MCRITQIPYLFTDCHHLSVVAMFKPCTDTHVPGKLGLYCGPAEWDFVTVTNLESHPSRCKNCRGRSTASSAAEKKWSKSTHCNAIGDLLALDGPAVSDGLTGTTQGRTLCQIPDVSTNMTEYVQAPKEQLMIEHVVEAPTTEVPQPQMSACVAVAAEPPTALEIQVDEEKMAIDAAKYGMSVEEYKAEFIAMHSLNQQQESKRSSMWESSTTAVSSDDGPVSI